MEWNQLSASALSTMKELGEFGPTLNVSSREIKGYPQEGKTYFDATDLRRMAKDFIEVANWLDARAEIGEYGRAARITEEDFLVIDGDYYRLARNKTDKKKIKDL